MDKLLSDESDKRPRYLIDDLTLDPNAEVLHFKQLRNARDEFGNRVFSSQFSYIDRDDRKTKAGLLVSVEGEKFILNNKGILKDIDSGIKTLSDKIKVTDTYLESKLSSGFRVNLAPDRTIKWLNGGGQSEVFLLDVEGKKYIIKTNSRFSAKPKGFSQPYTNEMLQVQKLNKFAGKILEEMNIYLPTFLFASGHVSCTEYDGEKGDINFDDFEKNKVLRKKLSAFLLQQNALDSSLWKNVEFDWSDNDEFLPEGNMVQKDGKIVWVDPFYHIDY